ncbi:MAG TPA: DHA2 family efflux MFS transporter permease subunit [Herpetosiphonaceae bacterium]|nr:DHA2 family efflux MFS transporter permease subunit [Herpetosiphonaceae bacterium]
MATATPAAPQRGLASKWKVLISVIFGIFMVILDTTVVNVAFRTISTEFNASVNDAQWILSIYVLMLGISTPLSGFLADRIGIKKIYLIALSTFVVGSLLCGLAPNLGTLIAARALQGFGGGLALPLGTTFLFSAFPPKEQGMALGFFGIALVIAPALGPILGGLLVDINLWSWIFYINIPIGIVGVFIGSRWLTESKSERETPLDLLGLIASTVGFGAVLYAASIAEARGWTSPAVLIWFGVGLAGLAALAVIELFVAKEPLLDLRLFAKPIFLIASFVGWVSVVALFGAEFLMPLYLQILRGRSALQTGFILLPLAFAAGIATPLAGRFYDRVGPRVLIVVGFTLLLINTWQLSQLTATTPISWIMFLLALRGLALGMTVQTTLVTALSVIPLPKLARGSALVNSTRQVVQSIGVALLATILASTVSPATQRFQEEFSQRAAAAAATTGAKAPAFGLCETPGIDPNNNIPAAMQSAPPAVQAEARAAIQQACAEQVAGFEKTYHFTFYVAILAILLGALLPGWPLKWAGRRAADGPTAAASAGH